MDEITLGQIRELVLYFVAFGSGIFAIVKTTKSAIAKAFEPIEKKIEKVDLNATKNFLVRCIDDINNGKELEGTTRLRFIEQVNHYENELHANSYIKHEVEKMRKEGKI